MVTLHIRRFDLGYDTLYVDHFRSTVLCITKAFFSFHILMILYDASCMQYEAVVKHTFEIKVAVILNC